MYVYINIYTNTGRVCLASARECRLDVFAEVVQAQRLEHVGRVTEACAEG